MKRIFGIVLGAMLIAGCTQKKTEEKAEWRSVDPMDFTTQPIDIVYVSEDRFTKHLMDENDYFTVTGFPQSAECKAALGYLGSASGRNEEKMTLCGLTVKYTELGNPYFDEGNLTIECRKIYSDAFNMALLPAEEREGRYTRMGMHTFYIGEILNIWEK